MLPEKKKMAESTILCDLTKKDTLMILEEVFIFLVKSQYTGDPRIS